MKRILCFLTILFGIVALTSCGFNKTKERLDEITYNGSTIERFFEMYNNSDIELYVRDNCYVTDGHYIKRYDDTLDKEKEVLRILENSNYNEIFDSFPHSWNEKNYYSIFAGPGSHTSMKVLCSKKIVSITCIRDGHLYFSEYTRYYKIDDESFDKLVKKITYLFEQNDKVDESEI